MNETTLVSTRERSGITTLAPPAAYGLDHLVGIFVVREDRMAEDGVVSAQGAGLRGLVAGRRPEGGGKPAGSFVAKPVDQFVQFALWIGNHRPCSYARWAHATILTARMVARRAP